MEYLSWDNRKWCIMNWTHGCNSSVIPVQQATIMGASIFDIFMIGYKSMDWFVGEHLNRKPSIFPWRSWGFPVNFPLIQSIELKTNHQKAMTSWSSEHDSIGEWGKTHQKTYDFPTTIPFFVGEIHPFTSFFQHFWWPPGLNGELMEWHSKKSMWTVEHALLGMKELVAHPV